MTKTVNLRDAARLLGQAERTVRRRVKRNDLKGELVEGRMMVEIPDEILNTSALEREALERDLHDARAQLTALREELRVERERNEHQFDTLTALMRGIMRQAEEARTAD